MLGIEIVNYFKAHPLLNRHFLGVFAADAIDNIILKEKTFAVINTDSASGEGKHWYVVFRANKEFECFDSLGIKGNTVVKRLSSVKKKVLFNKSAVQPLHSDKCGWYAIYFATARMLNADLPFQEVLNEYFTDNLEDNDRIITKFEEEKELPDR
jgi:hypothetical protein